jgi:NitT/TauT family transport system substrate-binding protein
LLNAVAAANVVLASSDAAWERIRGLVKPANDAEFAAIKAYYRAGIPQPWTGAETRSAEKLTQLLAAAGTAELMGGDTRFDPKLFHAAGS